MCLQCLFKCFYECFRHMLRVFHLDVVKIDLVLNMLQWEPPAAAACWSCWGTTERAQTVPDYMRMARGGTKDPSRAVGQASGTCGPGDAGLAWARKTGVGAGNGLLARASVRSPGASNSKQSKYLNRFNPAVNPEDCIWNGYLCTFKHRIQNRAMCEHGGFVIYPSFPCFLVLA